MSDEAKQHLESSRTKLRDLSLLPLDRFIAFSDGVFAIAITLLVLELPVPPPSVRIIPALLEEWPEFLGYLISFAFIGGIWIAHSGMTKYMKGGDTVAYASNLLLLLFVGLLPFTTNLLVTHLTGSEVGVAVLIYGLSVLFASLSLSFLMFYIARQPTLLEDAVDEGIVRRMYRERWIAIGVNVFGVALALVVPLVAVGLYLFVTAILLMFPLVGVFKRR